MQEHDTKDYDNILDYWKMQIQSHKQQNLKEICYADKKIASIFKVKLFEDSHQAKFNEFFWHDSSANLT